MLHSLQRFFFPLGRRWRLREACISITVSQREAAQTAGWKDDDTFRVPLHTGGESLAEADHIQHLGCRPKWPVAEERSRISGRRSGDMWHAEGESFRFRQAPTERNVGFLLKALLSHTFIHF